MGREVPDAGAALLHLEDGGWIEKVRIGESYRYRVLVFCTCCGDDRPKSPASGGRESILARSAGMDERVGFGSGVSNGVKSESVQNPVSLLAFDFAQVVGVDPAQCKPEALAHNLKTWKRQYGIGLDTLRLMMEEFARHPDWWRRSDKPPWRVFLARRDELTTLIAKRQRRDPSRREPGERKGRDYWLGRHTTTSYSTA